jgi:hypothetical protein
MSRAIRQDYFFVRNAQQENSMSRRPHPSIATVIAALTGPLASIAMFMLISSATAHAEPQPSTQLHLVATKPLDAAAAKVGKSVPDSIPNLPHVVRCPNSIIAAATNAPLPWSPSAVGMSVVEAKLSSQPPAQQQMLCYYEGSGSKWYIGRNIQPEFKSCSVASAHSFSCLK